MADPIERESVRARRGPARSLDRWLDNLEEPSDNTQDGEIPLRRRHPLDAPKMLKLKRQLLSWYYEERERQSVNRYQMAVDHDFYDSIQWSEEDAADIESRGQVPIVFNEVAPMVDWLCGTQRRTRVDWRVLPRGPSDVALADIKTKLLKYVSDINRIQWARSYAFDDAVKAGLGWLDDGARNDPTQDILYSRREDWRNVLHDSSSREMDLSDARYLFRWRWIDLDVAEAMFPDRKDRIRKAAVAHQLYGQDDDDEFYYLGQHFTAKDSQGRDITRRTYTGDAFMVGTRRARVKIIQCQYRVPMRVQVMHGPVYDRQIFDPKNPQMVMAAKQGVVDLIEAVQMVMHQALMTEGDLLWQGRSPYKHNNFTLTPVWCFRRGRDGQPYGVIRRVRDIQEDLNKRASKAQFVLSTNQLIGEEGAFDDWDEAREEADRPDGVLIHKRNRNVELRRDSEMAKGHLELFQLDALKIQQTGGVNNENAGRQSNSGMSGEAIKALQQQGSVQTTTVFDNLRFAIQMQGEKMLSNTEQFYSEPKVVRVTEAQGKIDWLRINQPEIQPDGSVRWINDITASQADFHVSEQDFHGSLRQAMFEQMMQLLGRIPEPNLALRLLRIAFEYSDFPNKDEIVAEVRKILGEPDPNRQPTPEEMEQMEQQRAAQQAAIQLQQEEAAATIAEHQAKARKINAEAEKILREVELLGVDQDGEIEGRVRQVQEKAARETERLSQLLAKQQVELQKAHIQLANRADQIEKDADIKLQMARIDADAKMRIAEMQKAADQATAPLLQEIEDLQKMVLELAEHIDVKEKERDEKEKLRESMAKEKEKAQKQAQKDSQGKAGPAKAAVSIEVKVPGAKASGKSGSKPKKGRR